MGRRTPKRCKGGCGSCKITASIGDNIVDSTGQLAPCWVNVVVFAQSNCRNVSAIDAGLNVEVKNESGTVIYRFSPETADPSDFGVEGSAFVETSFEGEERETYTLRAWIDCEADSNICAECGSSVQEKTATYTVPSSCKECLPANCTAPALRDYTATAIVSGFSSFAEWSRPIQVPFIIPYYTFPPTGYITYTYIGFDALNCSLSTPYRMFDNRCDSNDIFCPTWDIIPASQELGTFRVEVNYVDTNRPICSIGPSYAEYKAFACIGPYSINNSAKTVQALTYSDPDNGCPGRPITPTSGNFSPAQQNQFSLVLFLSDFEDIEEAGKRGCPFYGQSSPEQRISARETFKVLLQGFGFGDFASIGGGPEISGKGFDCFKAEIIGCFFRFPCPGQSRLSPIELGSANDTTSGYPHNFRNICNTGFGALECNEPFIDPAWVQYDVPNKWRSNDDYLSGPQVELLS